ncbi:hypothetical protein [Ornithinimicrobium cavernae]|uniref:hypothetical protein n=1 Tax=Ornithinimicrobium cavernae TaxID=2666047 RepID=UPI0012B17A28|nr:hypothetical protein [Ornithinimicrobium cavernae]
MIGALFAVAGLVISLLAWLYPSRSDEPSTPQERAAYLAAADALCLEALGELQAVDTGDPEAAYTQQAAILQETLVAWSALEPPRQPDAELILPALSSLESMFLSINEFTALLTLGDMDQASAEFERYREHAAEFRRHSRSYGFTVCHSLGATAPPTTTGPTGGSNPRQEAIAQVCLETAVLAEAVNGDAAAEELGAHVAQIRETNLSQSEPDSMFHAVSNMVAAWEGYLALQDDPELTDDGQAFLATLRVVIDECNTRQ